jgi:hypothetical protein
LRQIDFRYDLDEIVEMSDVGQVPLRSALARMPKKVGPYGVLYRDQGKQPAFFDGEHIQLLLDRHIKDLDAGNPQGHREADEKDFE